MRQPGVFGADRGQNPRHVLFDPLHRTRDPDRQPAMIGRRRDHHSHHADTPGHHTAGQAITIAAYLVYTGLEPIERRHATIDFFQPHGPAVDPGDILIGYPAEQRPPDARMYQQDPGSNGGVILKRLLGPEDVDDLDINVSDR